MWNDGRAVRNDVDGLALQLRGVKQGVDVGKRLYAHGRNVLRGNARIEQDVVALRLLAVEEENVACDGEMLAQPPLDGTGDEVLRPVEVFGGAAALARLDDEDERAARLEAGFNVVDGLGALVERDVLREAAAAGNDHVRLFRHVHLIDAVHHAAGRLPRGEVVTGENGGKLHLGVHHEVDDEEIFHQPRRLAHILVQRVALQNAVAGGGVGAQLRRVEREGVVVEDGLAPADARQDALASAAEARHHMMRHRAETDHEVGLGRRAVDGDRRAVRRGAEIDKVFRFAVVVLDLDAVVDRVGHERAQLLLVAADVRAVGNDDGDVLLTHAAALREVIHQMRDHEVLPHPEARHVAHDQRDGIARPGALAQRRAVDRCVERGPQRRADIGKRGDGVAVQLADHIFLVQRQLHRAAAVGK